MKAFLRIQYLFVNILFAPLDFYVHWTFTLFAANNQLDFMIIVPAMVQPRLNNWWFFDANGTENQDTTAHHSWNKLL
jgi:hypothetical protein